MSERVRVESVEALEKFRAGLCKFAETVRVGLDEAEAEIQRVSFWLKQEQHSYWKRQVNKRTEVHAQAKRALKRKKTEKTALGGKYSCIDEEKALAAAERRLEEARQKLASVRRWSRLFDEERFSYGGVAQGMSLAIEGELPNALAQLDNMIAAIEAYASSAPPSEQRSTAGASVSEDLGRPEEFVSVARDTPAPPARAAAQAYRKLRAQTPPRAIRDAVPIVERQFPWLEAEPRCFSPRGPSHKINEDLGKALASLDLARTPIVADAKIVVARGIREHRHTYLERVESDTAGDSGWYVGFADDAPVSGYEAVRIADFLAGRPDLEPALELPVGCLIVLDGTALEAVLDPQDMLLWPAEAPARRR
jgi:hypothetical protein